MPCFLKLIKQLLSHEYVMHTLYVCMPCNIVFMEKSRYIKSLTQRLEQALPVQHRIWVNYWGFLSYFYHIFIRMTK